MPKHRPAHEPTARGPLRRPAALAAVLVVAWSCTGGGATAPEATDNDGTTPADLADDDSTEARDVTQLFRPDVTTPREETDEGRPEPDEDVRAEVAEDTEDEDSRSDAGRDVDARETEIEEVAPEELGCLGTSTRIRVLSYAVPHAPGLAAEHWRTGTNADRCPGGDADSDGVCDAQDRCAGPDLADADQDGFPDACDACPGHVDTLDWDQDGVANGCDLCPGGDDRVDGDGNLVPDACDGCAPFEPLSDASLSHLDLDGDGVPTPCDRCDGDDRVDTDLDGTPDACDLCAGAPDFENADGDPRPDACDPCPNFASTGWESDSDGDGFCSNDRCRGFDDRLDQDLDTVPDGCDECPGWDDLDPSEPPDEDHDGTCDLIDACPGGPDPRSSWNDFDDIDSDGIPNACDCRLDGRDLCEGCIGVADGRIPAAWDSDLDGVADACDVCPGVDFADADADGLPDACDTCPESDWREDLDGDSIPDACDECPSAGGVLLDPDGDGIPTECDSCPRGDSADEDLDGYGCAVDGCPGSAHDQANGLPECACPAGLQNSAPPCDRGELPIAGEYFQTGCDQSSWSFPADYLSRLQTPKGFRVAVTDVCEYGCDSFGGCAECYYNSDCGDYQRCGHEGWCESGLDSSDSSDSSGCEGLQFESIDCSGTTLVTSYTNGYWDCSTEIPCPEACKDGECKPFGFDDVRCVRDWIFDLSVDGTRFEFSDCAARGGRCTDDALGAHCVAAPCGNGVVEAELGELCDDGNAFTGDGCEACSVVPPFECVVDANGRSSCALVIREVPSRVTWILGTVSPPRVPPTGPSAGTPASRSVAVVNLSGAPAVCHECRNAKGAVIDPGGSAVLPVSNGYFEPEIYCYTR